MTSQTPQLRIDGITSGYGVVTVLREVSLRVGRGEIVAILGANGAGKSTLLKSVVGLVRPTAGRVALDGDDITGRPPETMTRTGLVLVPEGRQLFSSMTVRENLLLGAYALGRDGRDESLGRVFDLFPVLKERQAQKAAGLSGGQQQMLAIGRGLMARPEMLLLDEPSLGLAPLVIKEVFETLEQLRSAGVTILIVEQNVAMTLELADRAYVLERGRVAVDGSATELSRDPRIQSAYLGLDVTVATSPGEPVSDSVD